MKFLSATKIHNGKHWLPQGTVLEILEDGTLIDILAEGLVPKEKIEFYDGIICPGFVNAHCHMELSHMKGVIEEGNKLVPFLQSVMLGRNTVTAEEKDRAIVAAIESMRSEGIVAVGDIANGTDSLKHRPSAGFHIHTFVESLGFSETNAASRFAYSENVYKQFAEQEGSEHQTLSQSIVPHAPYSVSGALFQLINDFDKHSIVSIHNQETIAENEFYQSKTGAIIDLHNTLNIDASFFEATGKSSLQSYLPAIAGTHPLLLVHNTFMSNSDLAWLQSTRSNFTLCLCPNANLYIEHCLPPVTMFASASAPICLGTDSLSSNHQLSIWSEVQTLQKHFPEIELEEMLVWATYNGAKALQMDNIIGSFEINKKPGFVAISADLQTAKKII